VSIRASTSVGMLSLVLGLAIIPIGTSEAAASRARATARARTEAASAFARAGSRVYYGASNVRAVCSRDSRGWDCVVQSKDHRCGGDIYLTRATATLRRADVYCD
jgi:hypothetical protein